MKKTRQIGLRLLAWGVILGAAACSKSTPSTSEEPPPRVVLETSQGAIILQLDSKNAPQTVENFLGYVDSGFYDQTLVHQVIPGQGLLAGGYTPDYREKPATRTPIRNEAADGRKNLRGTVAMVRHIDDPHSATSQFFINLEDNPELDHHDQTPEGFGYCVFGMVEKGMDVVNQIANCKVSNKNSLTNTPDVPVIIKSTRREK
ncbi:MAG: peptidylprolyl isomerase [Pirellulales bacterium]|nr:peptidylprolyl isomerase [Pirellulales bacterium]